MQHTIEATKQYQCRHIFTDGHRCASPCLRQEEFCYYHHTTRKPVTNPKQRRSRRSSFHLPLPEDRSAIQASIGEVLQRIAANDIDPRRAGLLLYGLQIASLNLPKPPAHRNAKPEPVELVEEITTDPELGDLAPAAEVGKSTERKSRVALLIEKILEDDERKPQIQPQPATLPNLQAADDPSVSATRLCRHPDPERSRRGRSRRDRSRPRRLSISAKDPSSPMLTRLPHHPARTASVAKGTREKSWRRLRRPTLAIPPTPL